MRINLQLTFKVQKSLRFSWGTNMLVASQDNVLPESVPSGVNVITLIALLRSALTCYNKYKT